MKYFQILSFLIITIFFTSCEKRVHISEFEQDKYGELSGPTFYDEEIKQNRLMLKGEYFTGTVFDNYSEDKLKCEYKFIKGISNGTFVDYYENGQLKERVTYKEGKKDGLSEGYYKNGQLQERTNYKEGKKDGLSEGYYKNGQLIGKSNFKEGKIEGPYESYYENGQLKIKQFHKEGYMDGTYESYYENGQLQERTNYKEGNMDGLSELYDRKGQLSSKRLFKEGKKIRNNSINSNNSTQTVPGKYPQSSTRQLTTSELTNLSLEELQIMRNEIFGRHGYIFKEGGEMNEYFSKQSWYKPQFSNVDSQLTPIEKSNIELILNEENNKESSLNDSNMTGLIKGNKINFRSTPSTESNENIIGELNEDYKVTILDKKVVGTNEGFRITKVKTTFKPINGDSSYSIEKGVSVKYLSEDSEKCLVQFNSEKGYISKSDLKSMEGISWYKIQYNEKVGWMYSEFIKTIE